MEVTRLTPRLPLGSDCFEQDSASFILMARRLILVLILTFSIMGQEIHSTSASQPDVPDSGGLGSVRSRTDHGPERVDHQGLFMERSRYVREASHLAAVLEVTGSPKNDDVTEASKSPKPCSAVGNFRHRRRLDSSSPGEDSSPTQPGGEQQHG